MSRPDEGLTLEEIRERRRPYEAEILALADRMVSQGLIPDDSFAIFGSVDDHAEIVVTILKGHDAYAAASSGARWSVEFGPPEVMQANGPL